MNEGTIPNCPKCFCNDQVGYDGPCASPFLNDDVEYEAWYCEHCSFGFSVEVVTGKCYFCDRNVQDEVGSGGKYATCYAHCANSENGKHTANHQSVALADSTKNSQPNYVVYDIWCANCGQSGSFSAAISINNDDIQWD